jgi:hypothetical protein
MLGALIALGFAAHGARAALLRDTISEWFWGSGMLGDFPGLVVVLTS